MKPAGAAWKILAAAGVGRYARVLCVAADPAEAAVAYVVLKMLGFPDVAVLLV